MNVAAYELARPDRSSNDGERIRPGLTPCVRDTGREPMEITSPRGNLCRVLGLLIPASEKAAIYPGLIRGRKAKVKPGA